MLEFAVHGAIVRCGSGSNTTTFAPPNRGIVIGCGIVGTECDVTPDRFAGTFGEFRITRSPCTMRFLPSWHGACTGVKYRVDKFDVSTVYDVNPALQQDIRAEALLTVNSCLVCSVGDKVTFVNDGQQRPNPNYNPNTGLENGYWINEALLVPHRVMVSNRLRGSMGLPLWSAIDADERDGVRGYARAGETLRVTETRRVSGTTWYNVVHETRSDLRGWATAEDRVVGRLLEHISGGNKYIVKSGGLGLATLITNPSANPLVFHTNLLRENGGVAYFRVRNTQPPEYTAASESDSSNANSTNRERLIFITFSS